MMKQLKDCNPLIDSKCSPLPQELQNSNNQQMWQIMLPFHRKILFDYIQKKIELKDMKIKTRSNHIISTVKGKAFLQCLYKQIIRHFLIIQRQCKVKKVVNSRSKLGLIIDIELTKRLHSTFSSLSNTWIKSSQWLVMLSK